MAAQLADVELVDLRTGQEIFEHSLDDFDGDEIVDEERTTAARGIMNAFLLSVPFWALIGFTLYLLL